MLMEGARGAEEFSGRSGISGPGAQMGREDLVLMAGGRIEGSFAEASGTELKALIRWDGSTFLERAVQAGRTSGCVRRLVVVGPQALRFQPGVEVADALIPEQGDPFSSLYAALEWLRERGSTPASHALVVATDLPFITGGSVRDFVEACPPDAELCLPVTDQRALEERFPGIPRAYVKLRDGAWKVGGAVRMRTEQILEMRPHLESLFASRKSPIALARILGPGFLLRLCLRRLTVDQLEKRMSEILGCRAAAVRNGPPELALDVDHLDAYRGALAWLRQPTARSYRSPA